MSTVNISGICAWVYHGSPNLTPIVLLHGGPGVPDYLETLAEKLHNATNRTIVRYDQRGSGNSQFSTDIQVSTHIEDIEGIRRHLLVNKVHLIGHSWGGLLALLYSKSNLDCVESLTLLSPSLGCGKVWEQMEQDVMKYNRQKAGLWAFSVMGLNSLRAMLLPDKFGGKAGMSGLMKQIWYNYFENPADAPAPSNEWLDGCSHFASTSTRSSVVALKPDEGMVSQDELEAAGTSLVIFYGSRDIYGDSATDIMSARYPNCKVDVIENSGHVLWLDQPVKLMKELQERFNSIP